MTARAETDPQLGCLDTSSTLAVFDFDGTLTDRHTFWRYLRFLVGRRRLCTALVQRRRTVAGVLARRVPLMDGRAELIFTLLSGYDAAEEAELAARFAHDCIPRWLRRAALDRLAMHQSRGDHTVLLSNSAESYLTHVARALGVPTVLGTRFESRGGQLTGRLTGGSCVGAEKVARLQERFGPLRDYRIYAYGDAAGDHQLLSIADEPHYRSFS